MEPNVASERTEYTCPLYIAFFFPGIFGFFSFSVLDSFSLVSRT